MIGALGAQLFQSCILMVSGVGVLSTLVLGSMAPMRNKLIEEVQLAQVSWLENGGVAHARAVCSSAAHVFSSVAFLSKIPRLRLIAGLSNIWGCCCDAAEEGPAIHLRAQLQDVSLRHVPSPGGGMAIPKLLVTRLAEPIHMELQEAQHSYQAGSSLPSDPPLLAAGEGRSQLNRVRQHTSTRVRTQTLPGVSHLHHLLLWGLAGLLPGTLGCWHSQCSVVETGVAGRRGCPCPAWSRLEVGGGGHVDLRLCSLCGTALCPHHS